MAISPLRSGDPTELGKYQLLARLGEGGMGTVYLGRDPRGGSAAIKVIRPDLAHDPNFQRRFRREVDRALQVPPFCTAEVIDADPEHETPYLVVEYVDGPSLAEVVHQKGPLPANAVHSVAVGVATALAAIHGAAVVHRDLKPDNVLLGLGMPKVIDFGIARALDANSELTRPEQMVGTIAYMAPERFDTQLGQSVGPAADVFAWGVVVAYAASGRTPFGADTPLATVGRILTQPPELDGLSGPLLDLVKAALRKDPEERPTALKLLDVLLTPQRGATGDLSQRPELQRAALAARHAGRAALRRQRFRRGLAVTAVLAMTVGAAGAVTHFANVAKESQASVAQHQANQLAARTLVAESARVRETDPGLSLRTAMAAQRIDPGPESRAAVTAALSTRFDAELPTKPLTEAVFRPDGKAAVTAGVDGRIDLWTVTAGRIFTRAASLPAANGAIGDVAFSPDGETLASFGLGVRMWDVRRIDSPRLLETHQPPPAPYGHVDFAPDGTGILVSSRSNISMWRLKDGRVAGTLWELPGDPENIGAANAFHPKSRILAGSMGAGDLTVWRLHGLTKPSELTTLQDIGPVHDAAFSRDGKVLALAQGKTTALYDMSDPTRPKRIGTLKSFANDGMWVVAFNAAGSLLATGDDSHVSLWDMRTPSRAARIALLKGHSGQVHSLDFAPDGSRLMTASQGYHSTILWRLDRPWDARPGATLQEHPLGKEATPAVGFSADDTVLTRSSRTGALTSWSATDSAQSRGPGTALAVKGDIRGRPVRAGPQHHLVLTGGILWHLSGSNKARWVLPTSEGYAVADMDSGGRLAVVNDYNAILLYQLTDSGDAILASSLPATDAAAMFTSSGNSMIVSNRTQDGQATVSLWNLDDPTRLRHVMTRPAEDPAILFATDTSDNNIAFSTGTSVMVWDVQHNREPITVPRAQTQPTELSDIAVSADGALLAIATTAGVELWTIADHATPTLLQTIPGERTRATFSARRALLAISDTHKTTLWDTSAMIDTLRNPMVEACRSSTGPSEQEWQQYAAGVPYQKVCA